MLHFRLINLFLANIYPKNRIRWSRHFFQTAILCISGHRTEIKMTFLILRSNWFRNTHFLFKKINSKMWHVTRASHVPPRPCRWLSWSQFAKWRWLLNYTCKSGYKSCGARPKRIFDSGDVSWPFVTWPWHWPVLSTALLLTGYLH